MSRQRRKVRRPSGAATGARQEKVALEALPARGGVEAIDVIGLMQASVTAARIPGSRG